METDGNRRRVKLLCLCIAFLLLGLSLFVLDPFSLRREEVPPAPVEIVQTGGDHSGKILVYVVGAVKIPGSMRFRRAAISMTPSKQQGMYCPMRI